jgi:electron transfer flavoprotein alpha subunit
MKKAIWVFAEQRDGVLQNVARELLGKARELAAVRGDEVCAVVTGSGIEPLAAECIAHGADRVWLVDAPELAVYTTEPYTQAVAALVHRHRPDIFLIGATTIGRDLGPRLAARLATGLTADCTALELAPDGLLMMTRPAFGGNLMATIVCRDHRPQMSTVRPGVMRASPPDNARHGVTQRVTPQFDHGRFRVRVRETVRREKERVDITAARVLVSGGRGVGSKDGFAMLERLADQIGAGVSSSRAMVDAGVMDHSRQVGQTGKTVRPDLYFALGISGAIQHLAGMEESEYIVAVNRDPFAPIFAAADLGIVGDVHKIIPLVTEKLRQRPRQI